MSARCDGTILGHLAEHMLYLSTASSFWFSLSGSHDHSFHLSQRLGMAPHDYAALLQRGRSGSEAAAVAEAAAGATARRRRRQQRGGGGQRDGGVGSTLAAVAALRKSVGESMAAAAGARRQWRWRR